jgi:hypothetical protein
VAKAQYSIKKLCQLKLDMFLMRLRKLLLKMDLVFSSFVFLTSYSIHLGSFIQQVLCILLLTGPIRSINIWITLLWRLNCMKMVKLWLFNTRMVQLRLTKSKIFIKRSMKRNLFKPLRNATCFLSKLVKMAKRKTCLFMEQDKKP